jgi:predicted dehydrogenase
MYKAGIVGMGGHGFRHLNAYQAVEGVEVVAVCDMNPDALTKAQLQQPGLDVYTDWEKMLESTNLDILSVVTNGPTHAPIVVTASESSISHIFCEKPFATSVHDARLMVNVCESNATRLAVSHGRRWAKSYIMLRKMIADGVIGDLSHFFAVCGGGLFACNGSHFLDLMCMLSGQKPVSMLGYVDKESRDNPRGKDFYDPGAMAHVRFDGGMRGTLDMGGDLGVPGILDIVGSMGRIYINELGNEWKVEARSAGDKEQSIGQYWLPFEHVSFQAHPVDPVEILVEAIKELLSGGPISCTGADGLVSMEMLIATHLSSEWGHIPIDLPLAEEHAVKDIPFT